MPVVVKVSYGGGARSARATFPDDATLQHLRAEAERITGVQQHRQLLLAGYPPKQVTGQPSDLLNSHDITTGTNVIVKEREGDDPVVLQASPLLSANGPSAGGHATQQPGGPQQQQEASPHLQTLLDMGFSEASARRCLDAANGDLNTALELCMSGGGTTLPAASPQPPPKPQFVRRIIDADNSCLFNAVGYTLEKDRKVGPRLRGVIAAAVDAAPQLYTEAMLGKPPAEYKAWIKDPKKWGGEIELYILAQHFKTEIAAIDVQTNIVYLYGEGAGYAKRIYVIYDGVHYDALAEVTRPDAPESQDQTVFEAGDASKMELAKAVAADLKQRRQYVDLAGCDLKCMVCNQGLQGQKGASEHAKATGHQNFGQI